MAGAPPRSAELDFADIFGGPPRRSSGNERFSSRGSVDSSSVGSPARRAWSGEAEAPVFGDRGSGDRRRHLGEEFYRDIFPASEAALPRRPGAGDWGDVFGAPASPGPTMRPRSSVSMKFNRDNSMPSSPSRQTFSTNHDGTSYADSVQTSPNSQMNNYLAQETPQQDSRKKPFSWRRYPFLSRLRSQSGDKRNTSNHVSSMESEAEQTPVDVESIMANNKFHFSFYKWAGKGALLVLPATMEENDAAIIGLKSFPQVVVQGFDLIDEEDSMSTGASKSQTDYEDSKSGKYSTNSATKEGPVPLFFDDDYMQGMKCDVPADSLSAKSSRPPSVERSRSSRVKDKMKDFMKIFSPQASPKRKRAPEVQAQASHAKNESKIELQDRFTLSSSEASEEVKVTQNDQNGFINVPSPMSEMQERIDKSVLTANSKIEGKVDTTSAINEAAPDALKDFVKIFSPEGSLEYKGASEAPDQTSTAKNESKTELQYKFTISSSGANEDVETTLNDQDAFINVPSPSEMQERMEKPVLTGNSNVEKKVDTTSIRNEAVPNDLFGGGREDKLDNTMHHGETYFEDLDGCLVISVDPVLHNDEEKEQIKIAESKICEWSRGKGGNIRSLLSTLQYVLWPESGWKPIPLVDVIEGAAVKKAYQKALLCLHPDKLQQRGASMHQKYIAEKVFDILQESWKEFNSVTFG